MLSRNFSNFMLLQAKWYWVNFKTYCNGKKEMCKFLMLALEFVQHLVYFFVVICTTVKNADSPGIVLMLQVLYSDCKILPTHMNTDTFGNGPERTLKQYRCCITLNTPTPMHAGADRFTLVWQTYKF